MKSGRVYTIAGAAWVHYWKVKSKQVLLSFYLHDAAEEDIEKIEDNSRRKLMMFKPWRDEDTLKGEFPTYLEAWEAFWSECSPNCKHALEELL